MSAAGSDATRLFSTFYVKGSFYGIDVQQVQEVIRSQEMTPVPLASSMVKGLINLRGQIVTAVDLRDRLGLAPRAADQSPMNVVVRAAGGIVSLLVDEIGDVLEVEEAAFENPPATLPEAVRGLILGVYKLKGRLLLVLDAEKALRQTTAR